MTQNAWDHQKAILELLREDAGWHELSIESPVASRVVADVYKYLPLGTEYGPVFDDVDRCPFEIHRYQGWLREKLAHSGLAVGLAGGPEFLPDINEHLPGFWRYIASRFRPRNAKQLARHIINHLEWYVDQTRNLRTPVYVLRTLVLPALYIMGLIYVALMLSTDLSQQSWILHIGVLLAIYCASFPLLNYLGKNSHKHRTNCAEFYRYLMISYSEPFLMSDMERAGEIERGIAAIRRTNSFSPASRD